jgi:NAD(P)-dependent dehydrogenase (short-subunit alcohol dehydrogenase family)
MFDLSGKCAIVTGSTRGIGLAIAQALIALGAQVVISSESAADTARVAADLGMPGMACDVTDDAALALVDFALARCGRLDILVCNAGITGRPGTFADLAMDDYAQVMAINLRSQVVLCNLALPHIAAAPGGAGAAVLVASLAGLRGNGRINAYAWPRRGWRSWRATWRWNGAARCARQRRIAWLCRHRTVAALARQRDFMARRMAMTPLRRPAPAEIAGAVAFLASPLPGSSPATISSPMAAP